MTILIFRQRELHASFGDSQVTSKRLVADTLEVDILLETVIINQRILGVLQNELKLIARSAQLITILSTPLKRIINNVITDNIDTIQVTVRDANIKVAEQVRLKTRSATKVTVRPPRDVLYGLNLTWL